MQDYGMGGDGTTTDGDSGVKPERRVTLRCLSWDAALRVAGVHVCSTGLYLHNARPPAVDASVALEVALPDGTTLALRATCVKVRSPEQALEEHRSPGFWVRVDAAHMADLQRVEAAAAAAGEHQGGAAPTRPPAPARGAGSPAPAVLRALAPPVGIDFGTTYTRIAVQLEDGTHLVADDQGRTAFPSVISFPEAGGVLVGWEARERLAVEPRRTIASVKRLLGRSPDDPDLQGYLASASFHTERGPHGHVLLRLGDEPRAVPEVCADIIRHACALGERCLGRHIRDAVLSMPVTFGTEQRAALVDAARLAGLAVCGLVEEPVAAALTYGLGQMTNEVVAVYDFGGGTFDFSLLDVSGQRFRLLRNQGDSWLGGDDFDLALAQWAADQFWRQTTIELRQRVVEWQRVQLAAEAAKRQLSAVPAAVIEVPEVVLAPVPTDLRFPVDRELLGALCQGLVARSLEVCREGLEGAGLEVRDVTQLVLTGGVTYMPLVQEAVAQFFERAAAPTVSADLAVVQGAAIHAARLRAAAGG